VNRLWPLYKSAGITAKTHVSFVSLALVWPMYSVAEKRRRSGRIYYVVYLGSRVVLMTYHRHTAMAYLELNQQAESSAA